MRLILRLVSISKEETVAIPFSGNPAEKHSHNLEKELGEGLGYLLLGLFKNEFARKIFS